MYRTFENQRVDLVVIYVDNDESCHASWTNDNANLVVYRNTNFKVLQNVFDIIQRLILDHQAEILNVTPIDWAVPSWTRYTLTHDQVITRTKAKAHVYSGSSCAEGKIRASRSE